MKREFDVEAAAREAKDASRTLATAPTARKNRALREMARALRRRTGAILSAIGPPTRFLLAEKTQKRRLLPR